MTRSICIGLITTITTLKGSIIFFKLYEAVGPMALVKLKCKISTKVEHF